MRFPTDTFWYSTRTYVLMCLTASGWESLFMRTALHLHVQLYAGETALVQPYVSY
eukprot:SAG25_NODE_470_length_7663_cov_2.756114_11_plen_55_part_00